MSLVLSSVVAAVVVATAIVCTRDEATACELWARLLCSLGSLDQVVLVFAGAADAVDK